MAGLVLMAVLFACCVIGFYFGLSAEKFKSNLSAGHLNFPVLGAGLRVNFNAFNDAILRLHDL